MLQTDPHGWTLTLISVSVVFVALIILYFLYTLSGNIFSGCAIALCAVSAMPTLFSCSGKSSDMKQILAERDSIINANKAKDAELNELNNFVTTISDGLDSLALQENILLSSKGKDGTTMSREQIKENLKFFEELLARQRMKIQQLQDSVTSKGASNQNIAKLNSIIDFLSIFRKVMRSV